MANFQAVVVILAATISMQSFSQGQTVWLTSSSDYSDCPTCPYGQHIQTILFSYYGNTGDVNFCNSGPGEVTPCSISTAAVTAWVNTGNCIGVNSCTVSWASVPSDPCSGVSKYLSIHYTCA